MKSFDELPTISPSILPYNAVELKRGFIEDSEGIIREARLMGWTEYGLRKLVWFSIRDNAYICDEW